MFIRVAVLKNIKELYIFRPFLAIFAYYYNNMPFRAGLAMKVSLNEDFEARTQALFGEERYARFVAALGEEPIVSVRVNSDKDSASFGGEIVPWAAAGRYLPSRPIFTADPLFHAGCYYVQEASSMFLGHVIEHFVKEPVRALDLCAAPGGKTTHLLQALPAGSMLVSNEPVPLRAHILAENVIKWGNPSVVVTKNEPADFAPFRNFFDLVVADAPCSGEGMFRKDSYAAEQWSEALVKQCVARQRTILSDIWDSLRPGGILVYSTCTFNSAENEEMVRWIIDELGAASLEVPVEPSWGITGELADKGVHAYRFIPGYTKGEGLFMAILRKNGDAPKVQPRSPKLQHAAAKVKNEVASWLKNAAMFDILVQGETLVAMPKEHTAAMLALQQKLSVLHAGLPLAVVKNGKLLPQHTLAMSRAIDKETFNCVELEREEALAYLHRESLSLQGAPAGYLLLLYKGTPIGFVKNIGNRANNMYPQEWRIRKNPVEL